MSSSDIPDDLAPRVLCLAEYVQPGEVYYVGRRSAGARFHGRLHTHRDFAELTWLEDGSLAHVVNGRREILSAGDIAFIRPSDVHMMRPVGNQSFTQMTVSFPDETLEALRERYFRDGDWAWSAGPVPTTHRLAPPQLERLQELVSHLVAGPASQLALDRFLLELLCDIVAPATPGPLPIWLAEALQQFGSDPQALAEGPKGLARLAGRSLEHVNRVLREATGRTATETINEIRLGRAAARLRMTDQAIGRIAADCGISNLSHFYRLFNARYRATPRQYRLMSTVTGYRP